MTIRAGFLADIIEHPDDTPRLICADWLEEHGDPDRAEFIRLQIALAKMAEDAPARKEAKAREWQLRRQHGDTWRQEVPVWARERPKFQRGFVAEIEGTARLFLKGAPGLFRRAPIQGVKLRPSAAQWAGVFASPHLQRLRRLNVGLGALGPEGMRLVTASPHLGNVQDLDVMWSRLGDEGVETLAASGALGGLVTLRLQTNQVGVGGIRALAAATHFPALAALHLGGNPFGDEGLAVLAASTALTGLRALHLGNTGIGPAGVEALAAGPLLRQLTRLDLSSGDQIGDEGVIALARSKQVGGLTALALHGSGMTDRGVQALATSPHLQNLAMLDIAFCPRVSDAGILALAESPRLPGLRKLVLLRDRVRPGLRKLEERFGKDVIDQ
jgi:uncharacterized protein (TIGR02996 family)